ncbi:MAG: TerB family tellurite resistance protein [Alphaproteobacteria bacterium]|nr:TerB family tellurite resistance protein [Alphaproteobacteria bacterium]
MEYKQTQQVLKNAVNTVKNQMGPVVGYTQMALRTAIASLTGTNAMFEAPKPVEEKGKVANAMNSKTVLAKGVSVLVQMEYTSLSGNHKDREVVIRRVVKGRSGTFLDVFCLDIGEPRLVKLQSVLKIYDTDTDEEYTDIVGYLRDRLGIEVPAKTSEPSVSQNKNTAVSPMPATFTAPASMPKVMPKPAQPVDVLAGLKEVIALTRHELTAMVFMSAVDGNRDNTEYDEIIKYVRARCPHLSFSDDMLVNYLNRLYPDEESFYQAFEVIIEKEGSVLSLFLESLIHLVYADGVIDENEKNFLESIFAILAVEGYDIQYKLKM